MVGGWAAFPTLPGRAAWTVDCVKHWSATFNSRIAGLARRVQKGADIPSMKPASSPRPYLAFALFALGAMTCGAQTNTKTEKAAPAREATASERAKAESAKAKEQAVAQRDSLIAEYEALARELKNATAEQKKAIEAKMQERKKEFEEAQRALHKQMREDQRRQRQNAAPKR